MENKLVTVFTPTYNRADSLGRLYDSLEAQNCKDFVWLIVDDGSVDDTELLVNEWKKKASFEIVYYYQKNSGKYVAHNTGVKLCNTELFVCIDSDDWMSNNAIDRIHIEWSLCKEHPEIAGIVAPRKMENHIGFDNSKLPWSGTLQELYRTYKYYGETALVYRTEILKCYLFPEISGERFMKEAVVYWEIDRKYKLHYLSFYLAEGQYLDNGLTNSMRMQELKSPNCMMLFYKVASIYKMGLIDRIKACACYYAWKKCFLLEDHFEMYSIPFIEKKLGKILSVRYERSLRKRMEMMK